MNRASMDKKRIATYNPDVFKMFEEKVKRNIIGLVEYKKAVINDDVRIYGFDSTTIHWTILKTGRRQP